MNCNRIHALLLLRKNELQRIKIIKGKVIFMDENNMVALAEKVVDFCDRYNPDFVYYYEKKDRERWVKDITYNFLKFGIENNLWIKNIYTISESHPEAKNEAESIIDAAVRVRATNMTLDEREHLIYRVDFSNDIGLDNEISDFEMRLYHAVLDERNFLEKTEDSYGAWERIDDKMLSDEYFDYYNPDTDIKEVVLKARYKTIFEIEASDYKYELFYGTVNGKEQIIAKTDFFDSDLYSWNTAYSERFLKGMINEERCIAMLVRRKEHEVIVDENHYNHFPRRKSALTGRYVSREMESILASLERGEHVDMNDIYNTMEIKQAEKFMLGQVDTLKISGREDFRNNVAVKMLSRGSAVIDNDKCISYNGNVDRGHRLDIVIGLPASGKSSAVVDVVSQEFHSLIIDNDEIKKEIPEYAGGWGATAVHKESQKIEEKVIDIATNRGMNIVLPKVGSNLEKMIGIVNNAKERGYTVLVHYVDLNVNKAIGRMINRYLDTGRFIAPKRMEKYVNSIEGNKISKVYDILKSSGVIDGYSKWDNDVNYNGKIKLLEQKCEAKFIADAKKRSGLTSTSSERTRKNSNRL